MSGRNILVNIRKKYFVELLLSRAVSKHPQPRAMRRQVFHLYPQLSWQFRCLPQVSPMNINITCRDNDHAWGTYKCMYGWDFSKFATHTGLPGLPVCFASHLIRPDGVLFTLPVLEIWNWRIHTNGQSLFGGPKIWSHTPICNVVIGRYPSILMLSAIPCILSLDIYLSKLFAHKKKRCFHGHLQCLSLECFLYSLFRSTDKLSN